MNWEAAGICATLILVFLFLSHHHHYENHDRHTECGKKNFGAIHNRDRHRKINKENQIYWSIKLCVYILYWSYCFCGWFLILVILIFFIIIFFSLLAVLFWFFFWSFVCWWYFYIFESKEYQPILPIVNIFVFFSLFYYVFLGSLSAWVYALLYFLRDRRLMRILRTKKNCSFYCHVTVAALCSPLSTREAERGREKQRDRKTWGKKRERASTPAQQQNRHSNELS